MSEPLLTRQRLLAVVFPLLLSLPFLGRATFIDDGYFVKIAAWLADHPTRPYDFISEDVSLESRGWDPDGTLRMVNPLAHHYFLAVATKAGGGRIWLLRLACVLLSCGTAFFVFEFARRWTSHPVACAWLAALTPAQWLTAHSLLIDSTLAFFLMGGLYFFMRATEVDGPAPLLLSGAFIGLALLSKYTAVFAFPLTLLWFLLRRKRLPRPALFAVPWIVALGIFSAYNVWTAFLYGQAHFIAAASRTVGGPAALKVVELLVFFSGASLLPLVVWLAAPARPRIVAGLLVFVSAVFFSSRLGGFTAVQAFLLSLWLVTTPFFLWEFWACRSAWASPRDRFVFLWALGFLGMMSLVMDWVAARYLLIVTPATAILAVRMLEIRHPGWTWHTLPAVAFGMLLLGSGLAYADFRQAAAGRDVLPWLENFHPAGRRYYLGDVFTTSYLREAGWEPVFAETRLRPGDVVLAKTVTTPSGRFMPRRPVWTEVARLDLPTRFPLKVMDVPASAGFYASLWGALPFSVSLGPWESFRLYEVMSAPTETRDGRR